MKMLFNPFRKLIEKAQRRFVRSRPGSVLILVVALLVLMALIGTAFMSMAQYDRASSAQHSFNTEIDLLLDGVINMVKGSVDGDIFVNGQFRPGIDYNTGSPSFYNYLTSLDPGALGNPGDPWLASRVPDIQVPNTPPFWEYLTLLPGFTQFSMPDRNPSQRPFLFTPGGQSNTNLYLYNQRQQMYPGFKVVNGLVVPAWINPAAPTDPTYAVMAADADGDGIADSGLIKLPIGPIDGITYYAAVRVVDNAAALNANIAWQPNPIFTPVTGTFAVPPQLPGDFFPSNIDLLEMLAANDVTTGHFAQLLSYRFGDATGLSRPPLATSFMPAVDDGTPALNQPPRPRLDLPGGNFNTALEAEWMQLGRRLGNPGYRTTGSKYLALAANESTTLARNFILRDPTVPIFSASSSILERFLPASVFNVPSTAYQPGDVTNWYNQNFNYLPGIVSSQNLNPPIRALLAGRNPVSNFCPTKFRDMGQYNSSFTAYQFGDTVTWTDGITKSNHRYVCINPTNANSAKVAPGPLSALPNMPAQAWAMDNDTWICEPWTTSPTKTSINTGTFGQLWLAYWSVMAEQVQITNGAATALLARAPYPIPGAARMFRSPVRVPPAAAAPAPFYLTPTQVMQLRAALAAVNTIDLRDSDDDVTSRVVHLTDPTGTAPLPDVIATVFGQERQPFITEVYATNAPVTQGSPGGGGGGGNVTLQGYVAIELYNPYPVPMSMANYAFATVTRAVAAPKAITDLNSNVTQIPMGTDGPWEVGTATTPIIPAQGYIVIASNETPPAGIAMPANVMPATPNPPVGQVNLYVLHNLVNVIANQTATQGLELLLVKPRHYAMPSNKPTIPTPLLPSGGQTTPTAATNTLSGPTTPGVIQWNYNEGVQASLNPVEMVPVDSYDFTGLLPLAKPTNTPTEWLYVRPSPGGAVGAQNYAWHFVYPGHYQLTGASGTGTGGTGTPRLIDGTYFATGLGTAIAESSPPVGGNGPSTTIPFVPPPAGANPPAIKPGYVHIPIQVNNNDFAGPNAPRVSPGNETNAFPYGSFARNGDILEVPFIGSYRLAIVVNGNLQVIEMSPVTMDSAMALSSQQPMLGEVADAGNLKGDPYAVTGASSTVAIENVGRFCPISLSDGTGVNDFAPALIGLAGPANVAWRYHFATRLFDYLTVQCPQQDYTPDADPSLADPVYEQQIAGSSYPAGYTAPRYFPRSPLPTVPVPLANSTAGVVNGEPPPINTTGLTEETAPVDGLININTANWRVLAAVPWLPPNVQNRLVGEAQIALSIVAYRDGLFGSPIIHGPFKSIFELNDVPMMTFNFLSGAPFTKNTLLRDVLGPAATSDFDANHGNITPAYGGLDGIVGDFESKYMVINRVSNLITTRSDSFTAYILLQGWRDAETANPTLVVQRRAALILDRSVVTPTNKSPTVTTVPSN